MIPLIKPWITPKKIYGKTATYAYIDEAMNYGDYALQSLTDKLNRQTEQRLKKQALDELFGE
ncbi:hypothetical protein EBV26_05175 [bacterium]|nr:hypothetical protein [bacterium]